MSSQKRKEKKKKQENRKKEREKIYKLVYVWVCVYEHTCIQCEMWQGQALKTAANFWFSFFTSS